MPKTAAAHLALLSVLLSLPGCRTGDSKDGSGQTVVAFAAASTGGALDEIKRQFGPRHGIDVKTSYAGTSTLAQQVVNGAGAEVFLSANKLWADYLEQKGTVAKRRDLLGNRLVVIVPADSRIQVQKPADLLAPPIRHLALADPEAVPAGIYAKQALVNLGLWDRLKSKVVAGSDVQHALAFVEGGAEAGIVYATDAAASDSVNVALEIPPELTDEPIRYWVMLLNRGAGKAAAESFYQYLSSPEAAEVFQKHGFFVLADSTAGG